MSKRGILISGIILGILIAVILFMIQQILVTLHINDHVKINVMKDVPLKASITENVGIRIEDPLLTDIRVTEPLEILFNEVLSVPLKMDIPVRLSSSFMVDDTLDLEFDIPLNLLLGENEMPLRNLTIPFNKKLRIQDSLAVDFSIPLDTKIRTNFKRMFNVSLPVKSEIPVQVKIPIDQHLQVMDTITLDAYGYEIPLTTTIKLKQKVPIKQTLFIEGDINVPVDQAVSLPIKKVIHAPVLKNFKADVVAENKNINTSFNTGLSTTASFSEPMEVKMEPLKIRPTNMSFSIEPND